MYLYTHEYMFMNTNIHVYLYGVIIPSLSSLPLPYRQGRIERVEVQSMHGMAGPLLSLTLPIQKVRVYHIFILFVFTPFSFDPYF